MKKKIQIQVCRSCGRDNAKSAAIFQTAEGIKKFYEPKLENRFFGSWAELHIVDCLTNCDTPNSVRVSCGEKNFDFAWISNPNLAQEVIGFAKDLYRNLGTLPSSTLLDHLLEKATGRGKTTHPAFKPDLPRPIWLDGLQSTNPFRQGKLDHV